MRAGAGGGRKEFALDVEALQVSAAASNVLSACLNGLGCRRVSKW